MLPILRAYVAARSLPGLDIDDIVQRVLVEACKSRLRTKSTFGFTEKMMFWAQFGDSIGLISGLA